MRPQLRADGAVAPSLGTSVIITKQLPEHLVLGAAVCAPATARGQGRCTSARNLITTKQLSKHSVLAGRKLPVRWLRSKGREGVDARQRRESGGCFALGGA